MYIGTCICLYNSTCSCIYMCSFARHKHVYECVPERHGREPVESTYGVLFMNDLPSHVELEVCHEGNPDKTRSLW